MGERNKIEQYLNVSRVAATLDCSKDKVFDLIKGGQLSAIKFGHRTIRIAESSLREFCRKNRLDPEKYYE